MKRKRSTSSEDQPSRIYLGSKKGKQSTDKDLFKRQVEKCEFCDEVFYNKYSILVHNAKHIIIPLLRQNFHQCSECLHQFTSVESLEWHSFNAHPSITKKDLPQLLQSFVKKEPFTVLIKENFGLKKEVDDNDLLLQSLVKKKPVTLLTKDPLVIKKENELKILQSFVKKEAITVLEPLKMEPECDVIDISDDEPCDKISETINKSSSIKDRIMFEDDDVGDDIFLPNSVINDLTTECKVNLEASDKVNGIHTSCKNSITLGQYVNDTRWKSVHYDELNKPGMYGCKICWEVFPTRYQLIIHESKHIRFKRRIPFLCRMCDWYVSCDPWALKHHIQAHHPDQPPPARRTRKCNQCGLKYIKYHRHMRNYHGVLVTKNDVKIKSVSADVTEHTKWYSKLIKVCDLCYLFLKNRGNINYEYVEDVSQIGVRLCCERCEKSFFELKLVRLRCKHTSRGPEKRKTITNEDRLKIVQQRLKKLKLLNKY